MALFHLTFLLRFRVPFLFCSHQFFLHSLFYCLPFLHFHLFLSFVIVFLFFFILKISFVIFSFSPFLSHSLLSHINSLPAALHSFLHLRSIPQFLAPKYLRYFSEDYLLLFCLIVFPVDLKSIWFFFCYSRPFFFSPPSSSSCTFHSSIAHLLLFFLQMFSHFLKKDTVQLHCEFFIQCTNSHVYQDKHMDFSLHNKCTPSE